MNRSDLIGLLVDIEKELHFRNPDSGDIATLRELILALKADNPRDQEAFDILPELESELIFAGVQCDSSLINYIRSTVMENKNTTALSFNEPRAQHYLFAHRVIPQIFFDDADAFAVKPVVLRQLHSLWDRIGEDEGEDYPSDEMAIYKQDIGDIEAIYIRMPETKMPPEAAFAALVPGNQDGSSESRYLVLELTDLSSEDGPIGVVCEWFADGSRKNHERCCNLDSDEFADVLTQIFQNESRVDPGTSLGTSAWDPSIDDVYDLEFARSGYRAGNCHFAFNLVPELVKRAFDDLIHSAKKGTIQQFIADYCVQYGLTELATEEIKFVYSEEPNPNWLIIEMPKPISPPEPWLIAILYSTSDNGINRYDAEAVYTMEMAKMEIDFGWLLGKLDIDGESHAIVSRVENPTRASFVSAVQAHIAGDTISPGSELLSQLALYAAVHEETASRFGSVEQTRGNRSPVGA